MALAVTVRDARDRVVMLLDAINDARGSEHKVHPSCIVHRKLQTATHTQKDRAGNRHTFAVDALKLHLDRETHTKARESRVRPRKVNGR